MPTVEKIREIRRRYRGLLNSRPRRGPLQGCWDEDPGLEPLKIHRALEEMFADPATVILKGNERLTVRKGRLFNREAVVKTYRLLRPGETARYRFRPSRARRCWAAGRIMTEQSLPAPEPYGFLELYRGNVPVYSHAVMAFIPDSRAARWWLEDHPEKLAAADGKQLVDELLQTLLDLYRHGIYHRDAKSSNLLVQERAGTERRWIWIDLECVQCGRRIRRHDIIRNLVQLKGSVEHCVSARLQLLFMARMAAEYPWLRSALVERLIAGWSAKRRRREQREGCESPAPC